MPFRNKKWMYSGEERTFTGADKYVFTAEAVKSLKTDMDGYRQFQDAAPSPSDIVPSPGERQRFKKTGAEWVRLRITICLVQFMLTWRSPLR